MKRTVYIILVLLSVLKLPAQFFKSPSPFDYNGDGVIRCAVLATGSKGIQVDNARICVDLEQMIKNSKPGMPVRVMFEEISNAKTIMGWWYHPDNEQQRNAFVATEYDFVFLAENKAVVTKFPEMFFEGVRISRSRFSQRNTNVMLLMMDSPPSSSVNDASVQDLTELTYRVADGCGVKVVPAALAWQDVMKHHIMQGKSLLRVRANSFLAAASIWCQISGDRVPKSSLTTGWIVKKTATLMARSAKDAVEEALTKKHYSRPHQGVTRMDDRIQNEYMIYHASTAANPALPDALGAILESAGYVVAQHSPSEWHAEGFDRHAAPFDLVCGSKQEMEPLLDQHRYSSTEFISPNLPDALKVAYKRNPANDKNGELTLRTLEDLLLEGYTFARENKFVFIPFQIAWARLWSINPDYVKPAEDRSSNDWLNYMLAHMICSSLTGCYQMPPEREKPHHYNQDHPLGFHNIAVRVGWQCMRQLSELSLHQNSLVTSRRGKYVSQSEPGFVSVSLLEPPVKSVQVLCEPAEPNLVNLSRNVFEFNSENFNIEQSLRCSSVAVGNNVFCDLLISTVSDDSDIDGFSTKHTFILNHSEDTSSGFSFHTNRVTLADQSFVMLKPADRPVESVNVQIFQNGVETAEIYFSSDYYDHHPICLFPVSGAISAGACEVLIRASSADKRFNGVQQRFVFKLDFGDIKLPEIKVLSPAAEAQISGPAFVTAEAAAYGVNELSEISLFCEKKRLEVAEGTTLKAGVEMGTPLSRLSEGHYPVWAALRLQSGLVIASPVNVLEIVSKTTNKP